MVHPSGKRWRAPLAGVAHSAQILLAQFFSCSIILTENSHKGQRGAFAETTARFEHTDPAEALRTVHKMYKERFQAHWLKPFGFNNSYALTVREADAEKHQWTKISDLKCSASGLRAGWTAEFSERPDGYPGLRKAYGFGEVADLDPAIMYQAIARDEVNVVCAFTTDGRIPAYNLKPLIDHRHFFPPCYVAPVVRTEILKKSPELRKAITELGGRVNDATI